MLKCLDTNAYWRHNQVSSAFCLIAKFTKLNPVKENNAIHERHRPDFTISNFKEGKTGIFDVKVKNPLAPSNTDAAAVSATNFFTKTRNAILNSDYGRAYSSVPNSIFYPLIFDVFGNMESETSSVLPILATHHSRVSGYSFSSARAFIYNKLICTLNHATAMMCVTRYNYVTPFSAFIKWELDEGGG